jgi:hypothetical protein
MLDGCWPAMQDAGISYTAWCVGIVKAAVLAKFMLLGRAANIGTRYQHMALIWPTLHMVFAFFILLLALTAIKAHRSFAC